jgi:uncharacterized delta-60 repeat protein
MWRPWKKRAAQERTRDLRRCRPGLEGLEARTLLSAGYLDPTFGTGGTVVTNFLPDHPAGFAMQSDGKIVAVGTLAGHGDDIAVERFNLDGTLDPMFGSGGRVTTSVSDASDAARVAIQADGRIVVAASNTAGGCTLVRYTATGALDTSFGTGGSVSVPLVPFGSFMAGATVVGVAVGTNGTIVVGGLAMGLLSTTTTYQNLVVGRVTAGGILDTTFGGGVVDGPSLNPFGVVTASFALQPDGKPLVSAEIRSDMAPTTLLVWRVNMDGTWDTTFGDQGTASTTLPIEREMGVTRGGEVAVQSNGASVQVSSELLNPALLGESPPTHEILLVRRDTSGKLDPTLNLSGVVLTDLNNGDDQGTAVTVQADGKLVVAGTSNQDLVVLRYNPDGTLDGTFGIRGYTVTPLNAHDLLVDAVALEPDGGVVVLTRERGSSNQTSLFRYQGAPPVSPSNALYVAALYLDLLQRAPSADEVGAWVALLAQGFTRSDIAQGFVSSPEYRGDEVEKLYRRFLLRDADPAGLSGFVNFLSAGGTIEQVEAALLGSDEYFNHYVFGTNDSFLQALYFVVLGRPEDPAGQQVFGAALQNGAQRTTIASAMLFSVEADYNLVVFDYQQYLDRTADAPGVQNGLTALENGLSGDALLALLLGSDEYFSKL